MRHALPDRWPCPPPAPAHHPLPPAPCCAPPPPASLLQVRTLIQREMGAALATYDALLCPAAPTPAYKLGEKSADPLAMYKGEPGEGGCRGGAAGAGRGMSREWVGPPAAPGRLQHLSPLAQPCFHCLTPTSMRPGDLMTVNLNLAGLPAVCLPCGWAEAPGGSRLPVGMQLIGRAWGEADLLQLAHAFEQTAGVMAGAAPPAHAGVQ